MAHGPARRAASGPVGAPQAAAAEADYREHHPSPSSEVCVVAYAAAHSAAYQQQSILTATPGQLVVMLYDGCLRFLHQAAYAMREGDVAESDAAADARAEAIIDELHATLDMEQGGDDRQRLQGIYVFCSRHLLEARLDRDAEQDRQGRPSCSPSCATPGLRSPPPDGPAGPTSSRSPSAERDARPPRAAGTSSPRSTAERVRVAAHARPRRPPAPASRSSALAVVQRRAARPRSTHARDADRARARRRCARGRGAVARLRRRRRRAAAARRLTADLSQA